MAVLEQPQESNVPEPVAKFLAREHKLFIGGQWVAARSGKTFDAINPATGEVISKVAEGDAADVDRAVAAARKAFDSGVWTNLPVSQRARILWKLGELIDANAEELAILESLDNGKPVGVARMADMTISAEACRYYAGWVGKLTGDTITPVTPGNIHAYTLREPVGVAGQIIPWNFPLAMAAVKIAPALAAGCTMVLKPAEQTPLTAIRLGELIQEAGIPDGVVNIITGFGETAGAAIVEHPDIDKVAFTGSTETGRAIVRGAAGNLKRVSLELGGKSPVIILPDADLEQAIPAAANGIFFNSGQVCAAGSRLYAHKKVFDKVVDGIAEQARQLKVGPGLDPETQIGPLVSEEQLERVTSYLQAGSGSGAEVVVGGHRVGDHGYFVEPTVFTGTKQDASVVQEEIFGPVLCAMSFDDEDLADIARQANDTTYGLSAYIWTRNVSAAHKLAKMVKAGSIGINGGGGLDLAMPFGGFKQSGWGRENGRNGIENYTEIKSVTLKLD